MTDLISLIERLKAATGPDRELDAAIALAISGGSDADLAYVLTPMLGEPPGHSIERTLRPAAYTASLDAAVSLVPEGSRWAIGHRFDGESFAACDPPPPCLAHVCVNHRASPVLALCAAALQARLAMQEAGDA